MCSGVPLLGERSGLSPSKNAGQGQHLRGSNKTLTQTQVLAVMGSTGTNQQANHLAMLTAWTPILLIPTFLGPHLKKRKRPASTTSTPRRKRVAPALAAPIPHSKCALRARARRPAMRTPPLEMAGAFSLSEDSTETDPWLRAMHALHVGARPEALPCRTEEYGRVMRAVVELLEEGSGGCICELFASLPV